MSISVAVLPVSDSFSDIWPRLIASTGAAHVQLSDAGELDALSTPCAVLVSGAGREAACIPVLQALKRSRVAHVGVVGTETEYDAIRPLLRAGAEEYFVLPAHAGELRSWLLERVTAAAQRERGRRHEEARHAAFSRLIGESSGLRAVLDAAAVLSESGTATILITGETGTGKDVLAQAIHARSPRAAGPFVEVNCAALPANLLEAELFGYEKGAFTDARSAKMGLVEAGQGGTLFLDEIGDLPLELQGKLLRVLETRRARRLGALREVQVDVRVVAATHVDLAQRVREGRFREDLLYRLDVLSLHLPPLRDREADSILLAEHFAQEFARAYDVPLLPLCPRVRAAIQQDPWPGNIRQLRNAVERGVILGRGEIRLDHLRLAGASPVRSAGVLPFPATLDEIQAAAAHAAVTACAGNKSRAADLLGISRKGLYSLLRGTPAAEALA